MKALKITLFSILLIFTAIYFAFLFVLPYAINLDKYSPQINNIIQDITGVQVEIEGLKIKTDWDLSLGAFIHKADLKYPAGEKFAQINNLGINISLIPLIFNKLHIDKISADKFLANIEESKIQECKNAKRKNIPIDNINIKKYRISFLSGQNDYTVKGSDLKISDFVAGKKISLKTKGELILNKRKQILYNISIFSKVFPKPKNQNTDLIKTFEDLYRYNVNANINTDLMIKSSSDITGKIDIDKISFIFKNHIYPQSSLKLDFSGDKAKINSSLNIDKNSKALISGFFRSGKHKSVNLRVISDKLNIKDVILIAKAMSKPFGKDLQDIDATGFLKADFKVKSDFKKVQSSGYLKIENANITDKSYNVSMNSLNADIDFSQDSVKIKQANANLDGQPVTIKGIIDKNANADISIFANNLQLKSVLLTSGQTKILKENDVLNGIINIKGSLKGRLDKTSPKVSIFANNIDFKNKQTKTRIKLAKAVINSNYTKEGKIELSEINIYPLAPTQISIPKLKLSFDKNDLTLEKTYLYINNIKANLAGKISDINLSPRLNSVSISVPNQVSVPLKGYANSNIVLKGTLTLSGDLYKPQVQGEISVPLVSIPSESTVLKNTTILFNKDVNINCSQMQIADSSLAFNAQVDNDFSKGIIVKNADFSATNFNLNTLLPIYKRLPKNSSPNITILKGKLSNEKFKAGNITSGNLTSEIKLKNNILYFDNLIGDAYWGKIGGNVYYDFTNRKTNLILQGRGLSANPALTGITGKNDDIKGKLDFDGNISLIGYSKNELLRNLNGKIKFIISNGQMGVLGKFEHLLYAQNIISNNVFKTTLNVIAKAITAKNTGVYKYMKGEITFSNGWANINWVKTSGPTMSLYITGRYYLLDDSANLIILGRISDDVVRILGPIGEFSMDKVISYIPKIGEITSGYVNQFTTSPNYENTSMIPYLTPVTEFPTKEFKVIIDGEVHRQSSVKSFKWISSPKADQILPQQDIQPQKPAPAVPDFVKDLPDLKN